MSELGRIIWETSRADESTISVMGADIVAAAVTAAGYRKTDAQARLDELVAWIDHTLTLPMYAHPTTEDARQAVADFKSWRRLLVNGLHPGARAVLGGVL